MDGLADYGWLSTRLSSAKTVDDGKWSQFTTTIRSNNLTMSAITKWLDLQATSPEYMPASEREMFCDTLAEIKRLQRIEKAARADRSDLASRWNVNLSTVLANNPRSRRKLKDA